MHTMVLRGAVLANTDISSQMKTGFDQFIEKSSIDQGSIVFNTDTAAITDIAGIARCRESELAAIAAAGLFPAGSLRVRREEFFAELLVPDRAVLAHAFPQVSVERASVDAYLSLYMKGAQL